MISSLQLWSFYCYLFLSCLHWQTSRPLLLYNHASLKFSINMIFNQFFLFFQVLDAPDSILAGCRLWSLHVSVGLHIICINADKRPLSTSVLLSGSHRFSNGQLCLHFQFLLRFWIHSRSGSRQVTQWCTQVILMSADCCPLTDLNKVELQTSPGERCKHTFLSDFRRWGHTAWAARSGLKWAAVPGGFRQTAHPWLHTYLKSATSKSQTSGRKYHNSQKPSLGLHTFLVI